MYEVNGEASDLDGTTSRLKYPNRITAAGQVLEITSIEKSSMVLNVSLLRVEKIVRVSKLFFIQIIDTRGLLFFISIFCKKPFWVMMKIIFECKILQDWMMEMIKVQPLCDNVSPVSV